MDNVDRLRQARHQAVKLQRRIWLVQLAFWPVVVLTTLIVAALGVRWLQRRQRTSATSATPARPPAGDAQAG
jgi:hypothetical protein